MRRRCGYYTPPHPGGVPTGKEKLDLFSPERTGGSTADSKFGGTTAGFCPTPVYAIQGAWDHKVLTITITTT